MEAFLSDISPAIVKLSNNYQLIGAVSNSNDEKERRFEAYLDALIEEPLFQQWFDPSSEVYQKYATPEVMKQVANLNLYTIPINICENLQAYLPNKLCNFELGMYNWDSPLPLVRRVLDKMTEMESDLDVIFMNGDFISHGVALPDEEPAKYPQVWSFMKMNMNLTINEVRKRYPGIDILPSIGNNDVMVHDNVPCIIQWQHRYYDQLFDLWFPKG